MTIFALKGSLEEITPGTAKRTNLLSCVYYRLCSRRGNPQNGEHNLRGRDIPA